MILFSEGLSSKFATGKKLNWKLKAIQIRGKADSAFFHPASLKLGHHQKLLDIEKVLMPSL
jgi:hypothetical protein